MRIEYFFDIPWIYSWLSYVWLNCRFSDYCRSANIWCDDVFKAVTWGYKLLKLVELLNSWWNVSNWSRWNYLSKLKIQSITNIHSSQPSSNLSQIRNHHRNWTSGRQRWMRMGRRWSGRGVFETRSRIWPCHDSMSWWWMTGWRRGEWKCQPQWEQSSEHGLREMGLTIDVIGLPFWWIDSILYCQCWYRSDVSPLPVHCYIHVNRRIVDEVLICWWLNENEVNRMDWIEIEIIVDRLQRWD